MAKFTHMIWRNLHTNKTDLTILKNNTDVITTVTTVVNVGFILALLACSS